MPDSVYLQLNREDYEHLARALVIYDELRARRGAVSSVPPPAAATLQRRWLEQADRFDPATAEERRERLMDEAYWELDDFVQSEVWPEFAWIIARSEWRRRAAECTDRDTRELVTERIYHEVLDEFTAHGVERLRLPAGVPLEEIHPRTVEGALKSLRAETRRLSKRAR